MTIQHWRYATEISGEPAGWSNEAFRSSAHALMAGQQKYEGPIYTGWVVDLPYAQQLPSASDLLAEMKERAAARGADVNCFDALNESDVEVLDGLLRRSLENWEAWIKGDPQGDAKRSSVTLIENVVRHEARQ
jgi:hypothetical protein